MAVVAGALFVPSTVAPSAAQSATQWGGWAMEASFGISVVAAAWLTFRAMELLYRVEDARALNALPLDGGALARERLGRLGGQALLVGVAAAAFVAPALARGPIVYGALACALAVASSLIAASLSFGITVLAGTTAADPQGAMSRASNAASGVAAGGVYQFAPGLAYAVVVGLLLLLKLGLEEPLRTLLREGAPRMTRAGMLGVAAPLAASLAALAAGYRAFAKHHDVLAARFADADAITEGAGRAYFGDEPVRPGWWERRLGPACAALYRKDRLQFARGHAMLVVGSWLGGFVALAAVWGTERSLHPATVAALASLWLGVVAAPARHLAAAPGETGWGLAASLASTATRARARGLAASRESLGLALPLLLPTVAWLGSADALRYLGLLAVSLGACVVSGAVIARGGPDRTPVVVAAALLGAVGVDAFTPSAVPVAGALMLVVALALVVDASRTRSPA